MDPTTLDRLLLVARHALEWEPPDGMARLVSVHPETSTVGLKVAILTCGCANQVIVDVAGEVTRHQVRDILNMAAVSLAIRVASDHGKPGGGTCAVVNTEGMGRG